jgi:hypothetical protein
MIIFDIMGLFLAEFRPSVARLNASDKIVDNLALKEEANV